MSMLLMVKAMNTKVGNPIRKLVLLKLADNANDQGQCWPSHSYIADQCECSKSAVKIHIADLIKLGLLIKENRVGGEKGNKSNVYILQLNNPISPEDKDMGCQKTQSGSPESIGKGNAKKPRMGRQKATEPINEPKNTLSFDNDGWKNTSPKTEPNKSAIDYQAVADLYNEILGDLLPNVTKISEKRKKSIKSMMTRHLNKHTLDAVQHYFRAFKDRAKSFYFGNNKTGWSANFDFVIRESTVIAVREGTISRAEFTE